MTLADHPGFMAYEDGSIEVLHADWPVYPAGHCWKVALQSLAMFPQAVQFRQLDDIDQCLLLLATGCGSCLAPQGDLFDERWFHVAVWRDDLMALAEQGFVRGVTLVTEYEAAMAYYNQHKDLLVRTDNGFPKLERREKRTQLVSDDRPAERGGSSMRTVKYVYWQEDGGWLGYLQDFPDYWTQGETLDDLKEHLRDLYADLSGGQIAGVRRVDDLDVA